MVLRGYLFSFIYAMACLILSLLLYKLLSLPKKYTRKVVHILIGGEWFILYHFLGAGVHFLAVCTLFLAFLILTYRAGFMSMISSDADNSPGTVYYAVAMTGVALVGCFLPQVMLPFGIGVVCTSVGDGMAGVVGQINSRMNVRIYGDKTIFGTLANFIISAVSAFCMSCIYSMGLTWWQCASIGLLSMGLELITVFGLDNISVTWGVTALAFAFMYYPIVNAYLVPIVLTPLIFAFAREKRALTSGGIIAALAVDLVISCSLGNFGFSVLSFFFIGSIIVDKIKKHAKKSDRDMRSTEEKKGDCRDCIQVLANSLIPSFFAVLWLIFDSKLYAIAFVASFAESFADTVASGLGVLSERAFDLFRWRRCEHGLSGGMSVIGTLSSLLASALVALLPVLLSFGDFGVGEIILISLSGFAGALIDSALGSLLQVKYRCSVCGKITERTEHCGEPTMSFSGVSWMDNDAVNLLSSLSASILSMLCYIFLFS